MAKRKPAPSALVSETALGRRLARLEELLEPKQDDIVLTWGPFPLSEDEEAARTDAAGIWGIRPNRVRISRWWCVDVISGATAQQKRDLVRNLRKDPTYISPPPAVTLPAAVEAVEAGVTVRLSHRHSVNGVIYGPGVVDVPSAIEADPLMADRRATEASIA